MTLQLTLHPQPQLGALLETIQSVEAFARANQLSPMNTYALTVAVEELLTNTILFGFKDVSEPLLVVSLERCDNAIHCEISDNGEPFDPSDTNKASSARSQAFPSELIGKTAPHLEWRYEEGRNLVRLEYQVGDQRMEITGR